jgi:hypothetical protein
MYVNKWLGTSMVPESRIYSPHNASGQTNFLKIYDTS